MSKDPPGLPGLGEAVSKRNQQISERDSRHGCLLHLGWIVLVALFVFLATKCGGWK
jgi:hypothetical protein